MNGEMMEEKPKWLTAILKGYWIGKYGPLFKKETVDYPENFKLQKKFNEEKKKLDVKRIEDMTFAEEKLAFLFILIENDIERDFIIDILCKELKINKNDFA